jgi:hypothetical protein
VIEEKGEVTHEVVRQSLPNLTDENDLRILHTLVLLQLSEPRRSSEVVPRPEKHTTLARREREQREVIRLNSAQVDVRRVNRNTFDARNGRGVLGGGDEGEFGGDGGAELVSADLVLVAEVGEPGEVAAGSPLLEELVDDTLRGTSV